MMEIISHRGYWREPVEKNSVTAFRRSFDLGFGTETDVRDLGGVSVISHDPPKGGELSYADFVGLAAEGLFTLAINIKADGLASVVCDAMAGIDRTRWFVFDMSIPDTRAQLDAGNPVYMRMSEVEPDPPYLDRAAGIWLDAFQEDMWRIEAGEALRTRGIPICIVSPELHRRQHLEFWGALKRSPLARDAGVILCTDLPEDAATFFGRTE